MIIVRLLAWRDNEAPKICENQFSKPAWHYQPCLTLSFLSVPRKSQGSKHRLLSAWNLLQLKWDERGIPQSLSKLTLREAVYNTGLCSLLMEPTKSNLIWSLSSEPFFLWVREGKGLNFSGLSTVQSTWIHFLMKMVKVFILCQAMRNSYTPSKSHVWRRSSFFKITLILCSPLGSFVFT